MAASASQTRMVASGMTGTGLILRRDRQQHAKDGAAGLRFAFNDAAVVGDDFGDEREAESRAMRFGGDEWIEDIGQKISWDAVPIITHSDFKRQTQALFLLISRNRRGDFDARPVSGGEDNFAAVRRHRVSRIAHNIHERLNQAVAVAEHRRKRWIESF